MGPVMPEVANTESFPALETAETAAPTPSPNGIFSFDRIRKGADWLLEQGIPRGASQASAQSIAQAPTLTEVRQGALTTIGEERYLQFENEATPADLQMRRREQSLGSRRDLKAIQPGSTSVAVTLASPIIENASSSSPEVKNITDTASSTSFPETPAPAVEELDPQSSALTRYGTVNSLHLTPSGAFPNGYRFPPKHTWKEAIALGFQASIRFTFGSVFGFLLVIYALNVVAWGGMIFLLLCGAGDKYMCTGYYVDHCNDKGAKKSFWIEVDAQVLTALFCVTAFGLLPWRSRDLYFLMQYRLQHKHIALRKLAVAHKGWFRLPGSHHLDPLIKVPATSDPEAEQYLPYPPEKGAEAPVTGIRSLGTPLWKMDFVVWMFMLNSIIQVPLVSPDPFFHLWITR